MANYHHCHHLATSVPKPLDGHQYSPYEVITILRSCGDNKKRKGQLKREWVEKKLVDIASVNGLNRVLRKVEQAEDGAEIPWSFGLKGRPRLLSISDLQDIAASLTSQGVRLGRSTQQQVEAMVVKRMKEKAKEKSGQSTTDDFRPCNQTIRTMMQILVQLQEQQELPASTARL